MQSIPKVSLEVVMIEDAKIFANVKTTEDMEQAMNEYHALLEGCGWSKEEYERLVLNRVDREWD